MPTCCELTLVFVEVTITVFEMTELGADDARRGRTNEAASDVRFVVDTNEQINVFGVSKRRTR